MFHVALNREASASWAVEIHRTIYWLELGIKVAVATAWAIKHRCRAERTVEAIVTQNRL